MAGLVVACTDDDPRNSYTDDRLSCDLKCRRRVGGDPLCCGAPVLPLCTIDGQQSCPPGSQPESSCSELAPECGPASAPFDSSVGDDWIACERHVDCVVRPSSCCGTCGSPSTLDMTGVHRKRTVLQRMDACGPRPPQCPPCYEDVDPYLIASCIEQRCRAFDVRQMEIVGCTVDADCILRPTSCCPCGVVVGSDVIAINRNHEDELERYLCEEDEVCAACTPSYGNRIARCLEGICGMVELENIPSPL